MGKLSFTWSLMGASWGVLKKDKELLIFPLISGVCALLVSLTFALPLISSGGFTSSNGGASQDLNAGHYFIAFLFYFANYFVIIFFNSAVVACAAMRLEGKDPTVSDGFQAAFSRLPLIAGWALMAASVGLILRIIEDRFEAVGHIVSGLLGLAWSAASFLVIPVLVIERKGPVDAFKESARLLKQTWGELLIGNFSFGLMFVLLAIPAFLAVGAAIGLKSGAALITMVVVAGVYLLLLALVQSVLQSVFQAAVYIYARTGQVPRGFESVQLESAMRGK